MKQAGCWIVYLRIESATQTVLDALGKKITIEHLRPAQVGFLAGIWAQQTGAGLEEVRRGGRPP